MRAKLIFFHSIRAKFLILATLLVIVLLGALGVFIIKQNEAEINNSLHSKARSVADLASLTGSKHLEFYNVLALDSLVENILKDPDVSFAGFYNENNELITRKAVPENSGSLHTVNRSIRKTKDSPLLGTLKIGYKTDAVARSLKNSVLTLAGATILAILLFAIGISIAAEKIILKPINRLGSIIGLIAEGDLSQRLEIKSEDEMGALAKALNSMIDSLNKMVGQVTITAEELNSITGNLLQANTRVMNAVQLQSAGVSNTSSAVTQINASIRGVGESVDVLALSADESSSSILEMASSVEEVALSTETLAMTVTDVSSSINQMAASIKQVNSSVNSLMEASNNSASAVMEMDFSIKQVERNAANAAEISESVRLDAEIGREALEESIAGIHEIKRASEITFEAVTSLSRKTADIGTILSVINDVTGQTNLLALNAAIIAAQAGEQGKGFAVVADEIKQLADRTRSSTSEITRMIKGVQEETAQAVTAIQSAGESIDKGEILADRSGAALKKIFEGVQRAAAQIEEIAQATLEQTKGSQQIRDAVEKVSQMVMQINSATQEQAQGSDLIISSTERMKEITTQVRTATMEQSNVGKFIATSTEAIIGIIDQIRRACTEQTRGSEMIVTSVSDIESSSAIGVETAGMMDESTARLFEQIETLRREMKSFKV